VRELRARERETSQDTPREQERETV
jgi:hypothetical protein